MKPNRFFDPLLPLGVVFRILLILVCVLVCVLSGTVCPVHADSGEGIAELITRPVQITSRTEPVLEMAVSSDGAHIVYVSGDDKPTMLMLASADPAVVIIPQTLADGPSVKSSPAISADGRYVAYVDTDFDVKGDIYLIDREMENEKPARLTGRDTEDGGPCFSADGRFLYFHQAVGNRPRRLFVLDLKKRGTRPGLINTGQDAMFCALSPDDQKLAFVSVRNDASGDIFVMNTKNSTIRQLTGGPAIDMFPQWAADGRTLYFSRIGSDTNHDNTLSPEDRAVICRIDVDAINSIPYPLTPLNIVSFKPYAAGGRLYFLSDLGGISNCWAIPETGYIRQADTADDQYRIAETVAGRIPYDPYITLLAYTRVIERFPDARDVCAKAGYAVAGIYNDLDLTASAQGAYQYVRTAYQDILPESVLAEIRQIGMGFQAAATSPARASEKQEILEKSLARLDLITQQYPGLIAAEARIESVTLLLKGGQSLPELSKAMEWLDAVMADDAATEAQKARALFKKAEIYGKTATTRKKIETYRLILLTYPNQRVWVDNAVERIIDSILGDFANSSMDEKIQKLNLTAIENQASAPPLAMGALNRIGDLYYATDQPVPAKAAYRNVIDLFPLLTTQTAAARLSLAEILFREEQFRKAIDLYETEISLRDSSDRIYQLARLGYIRKTVSAGEFLFRLGEIPSARSTFKELMDYDARIIEAHRGYIKCAAVSGDIPGVLASYRQKLDAAPNDPVWLYCTGLCLTYRDDAESARQAQKLIERAIRFNSRSEYFHQTLGYVYEVLETVYNETGRLELALMSYQKAYFLNDHAANAENAANLELNLGNIYYLMGQYGKALEFYSRRQAGKIEFSDPNTEIVFLKRYGECAFQTNDIDQTIFAYTQSITLIDRHIDPLAPSRAFDRLNRYMKEQIIDPAVNTPETKALAEEIARRQSDQNLKVAELTAKTAPPPSSLWMSYKEQMLRAIEDQARLNASASKLAEKYNSAIRGVPGSRPVDKASENLDSLTRQITRALDFPERLVELKAEISDRLGLAYQENHDWKKAAGLFEQVFSINEKTENFTNLAKNRRSVAYNTYQLANRATGDRRVQLLKKAAADFDQVLSLIERYGVPIPAEKEKNALIDISLTTSLDKTSATQAAKGFSAAQEKRLAETFISRIQLELGHLQTSKDALEKQLREYPAPESVKEQDRYGVSLLYHRAALLDIAGCDYETAFEKFAFSADLCVQQKNPVSAAANVKNMAVALQKSFNPKATEGFPDVRLRRLQALDKQTAALLSENTDVTGSALLTAYHNILGVFYFNAASQLGRFPDSIAPSLAKSVQQTLLTQRAVSHFTRGITLFEKNTARRDRTQLETGAALYLNMAGAAREMGDEKTAELYYQNAIKLSDAGVFPDVKWRALLGVGSVEKALDVLETVPLSRAGCEPMEIIRGFGSLVFEKLAGNQPESALNLAEKISELERFNRLAPYVRPQNPQESAFFLNLHSRLETIGELETEVSRADKARRPFIDERLAVESRLLSEQLGPDNENLPAMLKDIRSQQTRDLAVLLMSLSEKIEETANALADVNIKLMEKTGDTEKNRNTAQTIATRYQSLVVRYQGLAADAFYARAVSAPPDFITLMIAEPFEAMDLMEVLSDDDAVARIFHTGITGSPYAAFVITREEITAFVTDTPHELDQKITEAIDWTTPYIAYERPAALEFDFAYPFALSAKHLTRCISSRKPFKRKLLSVPPVPFSEPVSRTYDILSYPLTMETTDDGFWNEFATANTLLISNGPLAAYTVPTESERTARPFFAVYTDDDTRIRLEKLLSKSANLSLSLLAGDSADNIYLIGHLFSIYGCPGIIFTDAPRDPEGMAPDQLVSEILASYAETSGISALRSGVSAVTSGNGNDPQSPKSPDFQPEDVKPDRILYLGYQGMNRKESAAFAKDNFVRYVKTGRSDFDRQDFVSATVMFENAIAVANEIPKYDPYLPDLYKYARESAFRSGNNAAALTFAKDLADLYADIDPASKANAEAVLRLGLMYSKKEDYERAIPAIEHAVHMMSQLPPDEDLAKAFMDLGIVLENATNYETALSRFQEAADLSRRLDQSELLGDQYLNIGRVYDLRLNQYATAITNYEKALEIFTASGDIEKIAESKLNIGRCYRLLGNFPSADRFYAESLELIEKKAPSQMMIKVKILIEQANNAWFQGRYEEAFKAQRRCYNLSREQDFPLMQVISLNTAGLIWWTLGDYDNALAELKDALDRARALTIRKDEISTTLNNLGLVYRDMGNFEQALETFDQAVAIDTELQSKWGLAYDYRNQGLTYLKMNQPETAAKLFDQAYVLSDSIGNRINASKALLGKGDALLMLNDPAAAETAYTLALSLSKEMRIKENIWRALFGLAKIQISFYKNPEKAEKLLREAIDVIETLRADLKINQLKENFIANKLAVYETMVQLLADTGKPVEAFEMAERSRSRNFIDLLGTQKIGFADEAENALYQKQNLIRSQIEEYETLLAVSSDAKEQTIYRQSLENLNRDLENVMLDIQLQNPQLATLVSVAPVETEQLMEKMEPGVALISYYLMEQEIFCWILKPKNTSAPQARNIPLTLIRIPADRTQLERRILEYRRIIQNLEPFETHSKGLYDQLIAPILPELAGIHTLGIIPHGSLHYLSFVTLYNGSSFMLDDYALFYLPSAGVLEYTLSRRSTEPKPIPNVLAIGNPDLGDPILDLPFAEQEVYSIQWNFPEVTLLTRDKATEAWVTQNISKFNIIHIASHGEFDPVNPLLSAIKLAAPADKDFTKSDFDGNLEAGEIFGLKINADMVFLSACQTGLGKINAGDDVIGLNRSFFFAGTHTIISSLWRVSDVSTAVLIKTFYRRYMTSDKAESLKDAAMHVKARYPHPGYWGAFTLVGDYL